MSQVLNLEQIRELKWKRVFPKETKARIIPYYFKNNICYFLFGKEQFNRHPKSGIYNSFGGHREANETIFTCAKRELKEESIGIFELDDFPIQKSIIMQKNKRYILFVPFTGNIKDIHEKFNRRKFLIKFNRYEELSQIMGYEITSDNVGYLDEIDEIKWVSEYNIYGRDIYRSVIDVFQIVMYQNKNIGFHGFLELLKSDHNINQSQVKLLTI